MKRKKGGKESPNHPANLAVVFPLDALSAVDRFEVATHRLLCRSQTSSHLPG